MNRENKNRRLFPKVRFFRYIVPLICLGLAVVIFMPKISNIEDVLSVIKTMNKWLVGLAVVAQVLSYAGSGDILRTIMKHGEFPLTIVRGALITMAAASFGLVAGGWISASAATYYWISKNDKVSGDAEVAGVLPSLYNTGTLIIVTFMGMVYLVLNHSLSKSQIIFYSSIFAVTTVSILIIILALLHPDKVKPLLLVTINKVARLIKRHYDLSKAGSRIDLFYNEIQKLGNRGWVKPGLGSVINVIFDIITLYIFFMAAGLFIKPSVLIAGYSIVFLIGKVAFFAPGGSGVIEAGMLAIYSSLGISAHICVVAVLGYRLLSFWIPSLLGFLGMFYLEKTSV
ncbi:MAG: YbhN family protein [Clostridiaceae bacterium]